MRRLFDDKEFAAAFGEDPAAAMCSFDLTSEELAALQCIDPAEVTAEDRDVASKMDMNAIVIWTPDSN
jgi:hypothetical protein